MNILVTFPSQFEFEYIENSIVTPTAMKLSYLVTGVGIPNTILSLMSHEINKYDFIIQAGIAGGIDNDLNVGSTYIIQNESWGDLGVWQAEEFLSLEDLNLEDKTTQPNDNSSLINPNAIQWAKKINLPLVNGVTVNQITTAKDMINHFTNENRQVESMEGAAFHLCCLHYQLPFLQIRSLSNRVGDRDKSHWQIDKAMYTLSTSINKFLTTCI